MSAAEEAVRPNPNDLAARNHLAAAYVSAKRYDDGIAQFSQVLVAATRRIGPRSSGADSRTWLPAKYDAAAADFQALIDGSKGGEFAATDPQLQQAYYELGVIALDQDRPADAIVPLEAALKIDGGDADALYSFGMALIGTGDPAKGVPALQQAVGSSRPAGAIHTPAWSKGYTALERRAGASYATGMVAFCDGQLDEASTTLARADYRPDEDRGAARAGARRRPARRRDGRGRLLPARSWRSTQRTRRPRSASASSAPSIAHASQPALAGREQLR